MGPDGAGVIDFSLQQLVLRFIAIVFIAALHGFAVAAAACALGDPGPGHDGRLSLNPLAHLDVVGTASGVLFSVGWIRPIAVDPDELRVGRIGLLIIVAAGAAASLIGAIALRLLRPLVLPLLPDATSAFIFSISAGDLQTIAILNLVIDSAVNLRRHLVHGQIAVYRHQTAFGLIVISYRPGLQVKLMQPFANHFLAVIIADDKLRPINVTKLIYLGRLKVNVIGAATGRTRTTPGKPAQQFIIVDIQPNHNRQPVAAT